MIKKIVMLLMLSSNTYPAINMLSIHSRANCVNNESITWDARWYRTYDTATEHSYEDNETGERSKHTMEVGWQDTWRSAAVHWGEGVGMGSKWSVKGWHFMKDEVTGDELFLGYSYATDCNIYDGWWEAEGPIPVIDTHPPKHKVAL